MLSAAQLEVKYFVRYCIRSHIIV